MKFAYLMAFLIISNFALSQNKVDASGKKHGPWTKLYPNSKVAEYTGQFRNGVPIGKFVYKYPGGKTKMVVEHNETTKRSEAFAYYEDGKLMSHGIYKQQKKDSVWTQFGYNGNISSRETYKNGLQDGTTLVYFYNEENIKKLLVAKELKYSQGELNGTSIEYFTNGVVRSKTNYLNGKLHGSKIQYQPDGKMLFDENYKNGKKHGFFRTFDDSGIEIGRHLYQYGNLYTEEQAEKFLQQCKASGKSPNL